MKFSPKGFFGFSDIFATLVVCSINVDDWFSEFHHSFRNCQNRRKQSSHHEKLKACFFLRGHPTKPASKKKNSLWSASILGSPSSYPRLVQQARRPLLGSLEVRLRALRALELRRRVARVRLRGFDLSREGYMRSNPDTL